MEYVDWNIERIYAGDLDEQIQKLGTAVPAEIRQQWQPTLDRPNESILFNSLPLEQRQLIPDNSSEHKPVSVVNMGQFGAPTQGLTNPGEALLSRVWPIRQQLRYPVKKEPIRQYSDSDIEIYSDSSDSDSPAGFTGNDIGPQIPQKSPKGPSFAPSGRPTFPSTAADPTSFVPGSAAGEMFSDRIEIEEIKLTEFHPKCSSGTTPQTGMSTSCQPEMDTVMETTDFETTVPEPTEEQEKALDPDYIPGTMSGRSHTTGSRPRSKTLLKHKKSRKVPSSYRGLSFFDSPKRKKAGPRRPNTTLSDFVCPECPYIPKSEGGFRKHRRAHQNPKNMSCEHCKRPFASKSVLKVHLTRDHSANMSTPQKPVNTEHADDPMSPERDDSRESGQNDHVESTGSDNSEEHPKLAEGVPCTDGSSAQSNEKNISKPCNYSTYNDSEYSDHLNTVDHKNNMPNVCELCKFSTMNDKMYFDHIRTFGHNCNENRWKTNQRRKNAHPYNRAKMTCADTGSRTFQDPPTKKRMTSKPFHTNASMSPDHGGIPQILPSVVNPVEMSGERASPIVKNTVELVSDFTDFAQKPYSCVFCFFRTGEPGALQKHCRVHLTGEESDPEDDSMPLSPENIIHQTDNGSPLGEPTVLPPHTDYPSYSWSPPLIPMSTGAPAGEGPTQTNPPREPLSPNPTAFRQPTSSLPLINPWTSNYMGSQFPNRTEDLMEKDEDYEKDPSNVQQYKCRYCTLRVNVLRRLMRHFDKCHSDIVKVKAEQARRYREVINLG